MRIAQLAPLAEAVSPRHVVPPAAPPARRGSNPERDRKFESGFLQRRVEQISPEN
jgi:hypothetical protein